MIKKIKSNSKYLIFVFVLIVLNTLFVYNFREKFDINWFIVPFLMNVIYIIIYSVIFWKFDKLKIEYIYLMMIIPISLSFLVLFPLNRIPDEGSHLLRAYEISSGSFVTHNHNWDASFYKIINNENYKDVLKSSKVKKTKDKLLYMYNNASLYCFVCYIPQSIGIKIARVIGLNAFYQAYAGRLFNLAVFIAMMFFAIKLVPYKRNVYL